MSLNFDPYSISWPLSPSNMVMMWEPERKGIQVMKSFTGDTKHGQHTELRKWYPCQSCGLWAWFWVYALRKLWFISSWVVWSCASRYFSRRSDSICMPHWGKWTRCHHPHPSLRRSVALKALVTSKRRAWEWSQSRSSACGQNWTLDPLASIFALTCFMAKAMYISPV